MSNQNITLKGNKVTVSGREVCVGDGVPDFKLTGNDMGDVDINSFQGKVLVVASIPSVDTPVCAVETKRFNEELSNLSDDVAVLTVSRDLPFALSRWCGAEGVDRVVTASDFKYRTFGEAFGVELPDIGILARAVFVVDKEGKVQHGEYVSEVGEEPNYEAALNKVRELL